MADFDNGLPPQGKDVSKSEINAVLINKEEVGDDAYRISSVLMNKVEVEESATFSISRIVLDKAEARPGEAWSVSNILIDKQEAEYHNRCMFLYTR